MSGRANFCFFNECSPSMFAKLVSTNILTTSDDPLLDSSTGSHLFESMSLIMLLFFSPMLYYP